MVNGNCTQAKTSKYPNLRVMFWAGLIVLLAGQVAACSGGSSGNRVNNLHQPTSSIGSYPTSGFNYAANATLAGLQVHTDGVLCGAFLILKNPGASYSSKGIEDINQYASTNVGPLPLRSIDITSNAYGVNFETTRSGQIYFAIPQNPDTTGMPSSLQWAPGGESCFGQLEITNVSRANLVISSVGATLNQDAAPNTTNYKLLDVCSLPNYVCIQPGGAAPDCSYFATIDLAGGHRGAHVDAPIVIANAQRSQTVPCVTPLTLSPGQSQDVDLVFSSKPQHLVYSIALTLRVDGKVYMAPSGLSQSLTFIDGTSAFSCYAYQNGRFVVEQPESTADYAIFLERDCV